MDINQYLSEFKEQGYTIIPILKTRDFTQSRTFIADFIREKFKCKGSDEYILNNCHQFIEEISDFKVNALIIELINEFKKSFKMDEIVYKASEIFISSLIGNDIASQKNPNIVFQYPFSSRISELHSDAPANSFYEIVSWVPLVNCHSTKSFYILNKDKSRELINKYKQNSFNTWSEYTKEAIENAIHLKIDYGSALFFWSGLLHGSVTNETKESRWSYNVRYKNLFAPSGMKDPLVFYRVFKKSHITFLANEK